MKRLLFALLVLAFAVVELQAQSCFTKVWSGNGLDQVNFYITRATFNGTPLQPGDEIAVFDGDYCVGVSVLTEVLTGKIGRAHV